MKTALISIIHQGAKDLKILDSCIKALDKICHIEKISSIYESLSEGVSHNVNRMSPLGQALVVSLLVGYKGEAKELNQKLFLIEEQENKKQEGEPLSLGLLVMEDEVSMLPSLSLPHPELHKRAELLIPASEIFPNYEHPILEKTLLSLQNHLAKEERLVFYARSKQLKDLS